MRPDAGQELLLRLGEAQALDEIYFYVKPQDQMERSWDDVPENIKNTFERLGIPEAEQKALAGVGAQYESEMKRRTSTGPSPAWTRESFDRFRSKRRSPSGCSSSV